MKRLSLQWRITIMTALLTCAACVLTNCLVGYTGIRYMDAIGSDISAFNAMSRGTLDPALLLSISDTRLSRFFAGLPRPFSYQSRINYAVLTPQDKSRGLGSFPFARRY